MRVIALALLAALGGGCPISPVIAQQKCRPTIDVATELTKFATESGAKLALYRGDEAKRAMAFIVAGAGEPPKKVELTHVILFLGTESAMVFLVEGEETCVQLKLTLEVAARLQTAAGGQAV